DLDRAHGPAGGDDHIVGPAVMVEIAVLVGVAAVLGREPLAVAPDLDLTGDARRTGRAVGRLHLDATAGDGLAERAGLHRQVLGARIAREDHADLGRAVHAARRHAEGLLDEGLGGAVHRL